MSKLPPYQPDFKFHGVPVAATSVDTSPENLGMDNDEETVTRRNSSQGQPSKVKRVVEKTVDKLSRSRSTKSSSSSESPHSPSRRRFFTLTGKRKTTADATDSSEVDSDVNSKLSPRSSAVLSRRSRPGDAAKQAGDDSPFINPPSPTASPIRPSINAFRGDGSMRAGTQTLIQALQAIPWSEDPADQSGDSDEEETQLTNLEAMASSLHTIHRPVARSRRTGPIRQASVTSHQLGRSIAESDESDAEEIDFEATPKPSHAASPTEITRPSPASSQEIISQSILHSRALTRTGSMTTVRLQRRARLADKLRDVFEIDEITEVWAEMPCWLLRSILLQGYLYLTNSHICFFAHMPSREDQILKSGSLNKKASRTKRWIKHWFVLKNDALSWYQSSYDPYFPHGIVDLRYVISCDPVHEKDFRIRTNQKVIHLSADSVPSREEWVKAIRKIMFKAQNMGDSVKIAIPYSAILDIEKSNAMDFSETIEVKVFDKEVQGLMDSYFFAYFHDMEDALTQLRDAVRTHRQFSEQGSPQAVKDTTVVRNIPPSDRAQTVPTSESARSSSSAFKLPSLFRSSQAQDSSSSSTIRAESSPADLSSSEDFTHITHSTNTFVPTITSSPQPGGTFDFPTHDGSSHVITPKPSNLAGSHHTYPPSSSDTEHPPLRETPSSSSTSSGWSIGSIGVPSWLRGNRRISGTPEIISQSVTSPTPSGNIREVYSAVDASRASGSGNGDLAFSVLETPDMPVDSEMTDKFRSTFAFDERETLLGYIPGYLFRLLPVYGRLFVSTNYFCFKSSNPLTKTRMNLPIRDILSVEKSKGNRFGHYGLIVIIKGHEEIFFEFGAQEKANVLARLLERQIEDVRKRLESGEAFVPTPGHRDALVLEEFETQAQTEDDPRPTSEAMSDSLPALMFTSASSTFLTFKPSTPLRFTFLTIGSRGDVQPYIALAKGLMAEGHHTRIATHGEFKEWVESHGIEFGYVGGDPAELMRICVENGTFTLSFMKEGLQKFRGWIDDLLKTSWEACQGTDVLVESPSAMGGYHIAEALRIPYFRAFTMTWTRTRAYPHAFAVPDHKMGGSYNYMSYVMFDQVFWRATSGQINRWRRNVLRLESTSLDKMEPHKIPFLYNFSPSVVPPPLDWPEWIRVTGYWFLDDADVSSKKWTPPEDLVKFIDTAHELGRKVVYIGFGSIVVSDPKTMTRCVIEAVVRSGVCAVLSKGWSDRLHIKTSDASETEEPLPPQIYQITSVPHDWLFQRIDAACHHGGAGTTGASLRAGIPTIVKPFFGDQFFWADRVEALGVGSGVRKFTVETLTDALVTATTDVKQIERAKHVGEQIRSEDGVVTAIEAIYRDLDYARSLIKRAPNNTDEGEDGTVKQRSSSSSSGSGHTASEDWSVISDQEEHHRLPARANSNSDKTSKRTGLASAVKSVLPGTSRIRASSPTIVTIS